MITTLADSFVPSTMTPTSVICCDQWGNAGTSMIGEIVDQHRLRLRSIGLREEGICAHFQSRKDAALFRLFYEGETLVSE